MAKARVKAKRTWTCRQRDRQIHAQLPSSSDGRAYLQGDRHTRCAEARAHGAGYPSTMADLPLVRIFLPPSSWMSLRE